MVLVGIGIVTGKAGFGQTVDRLHRLLVEFEIKDVEIGFHPFKMGRFGQWENAVLQLKTQADLGGGLAGFLGDFFEFFQL